MQSDGEIECQNQFNQDINKLSVELIGNELTINGALTVLFLFRMCALRQTLTDTSGQEVSEMFHARFALEYQEREVKTRTPRRSSTAL